MDHPWPFLLLLLFASSTQASEPSASCLDGHTQVALNDCAATMAKTADSALAEFYTRYQRRLNPVQVQLFQSAIADWLRYRKSYCEFESSGVSGGSAYPMVFDLCMADQAELRLKALRKLS